MTSEGKKLVHAYIPESYKIIGRLGDGSYGAVYRCLKPGTDQEVAVKTPIEDPNDLENEAIIMSVIMAEKLDEANIIQCYGELSVNDAVSLEFELLDVSLEEWFFRRGRAMFLDDIRKVIQQLAVAFSGIKRVGVIHTDLKMDNVMFVDQARQPFKLKLIDFGCAILTCEAVTGIQLQVEGLRAPEIILGLPFSLPIDIWSLGCMLGTMLLNVDFFDGNNEYETLQYIMKVLGPPPGHMLDAGMWTDVFFKKRGDSWTLKTPKEFWEDEGKSQPPTTSQKRAYKYKSLDEMMTKRRDIDEDPEELRECVALLKAMLHWDAKERITPEGILNHPFITRSFAENRSHSSQSVPPAEPLQSPAEPPGEVTAPEIGERPDSSTPLEPTGTAEDAEKLSFKEEEKTAGKKEMKKNCFRRFISWIDGCFPHKSTKEDSVPPADPQTPAAVPSGDLTVQHNDGRPDGSTPPAQNDCSESSERCAPQESEAPAIADCSVEPTDGVEPSGIIVPVKDEEMMTPKMKKKKNCIRRMMSWIRKKLRVAAPEER